MNLTPNTEINQAERTHNTLKQFYQNKFPKNQQTLWFTSKIEEKIQSLLTEHFNTFKVTENNYYTLLNINKRPYPKRV